MTPSLALPGNFHSEFCIVSTQQQFDPGRPVEDLASLIVDLQDGTDFAKGDVGNLQQVLLLGTPEERNPMKYADIFALVAENVQASPWMRVSARIEEVNGLRRRKNPNHEHCAQKLATIARDAVAVLPDTPSRSAILGDIHYNRGILLRGPRRYEEARDAQYESSAWYGLAGNREKQFVAIFVGLVEDASRALVAGLKPESTIRALVAADEMIDLAFEPRPTWMRQNAQIHIAWVALMWYLRDKVDAAREIFEGHFHDARDTKSAQWAEVFRVAGLFLDDDFESVVTADPVDIASSSAANAALTIELLRALAEHELGRTEDARKRIAAVRDYIGPDGGVPIAVANSFGWVQ